MADLTISKSYVDGNALTKALLDTSFDDVSTYINARNNGTAWALLAVTGAATLSSTLSVAGVSTLTGGVANLLGYRRPNLVYVSATQLDVESNTGTSNQTMIVFPDGTLRTVTEDTSLANKYRRFDITAAAEFTSGTEDSGLRSGITEAVNTWYAIYAVKSTINTSNFVLAGDTTLPLQANYATLNSRYGTNGWLYLGMICNGDNSGATGNIVRFTQCGNKTKFNNSPTSSSALANVGIRFANTAGATSLTYTYAAGTAAAQIPDNITLADYCVSATTTTTIEVDAQSDGALNYFTVTSTSGFGCILTDVVAAHGVKINCGGSAASTINLAGWRDNALCAGINPAF